MLCEQWLPDEIDQVATAHCVLWKMVNLVLLDEMRKPLEDLKQRIQEIGDSL